MHTAFSVCGVGAAGMNRVLSRRLVFVLCSITCVSPADLVALGAPGAGGGAHTQAHGHVVRAPAALGVLRTAARHQVHDRLWPC